MRPVDVTEEEIKELLKSAKNNYSNLTDIIFDVMRDFPIVVEKGYIKLLLRGFPNENIRCVYSFDVPDILRAGYEKYPELYNCGIINI